ncbi:hypothetical protein INR49_005843 [Caranx melampygus]|nr:hypothetical protein INR49_005843 [Caranx melampygus]
MDNLKEEMLVQAKKHLEIQQQNEAEKRKLSESFDGSASLNETQTQEKYDRAVKKINQMKEERKELKEKLDVDLQSSRKENERLSAELQKLQSVMQNMDEVRRENQELSRRLETQQETQQDASGPDDDLKVRVQTLARQLQDSQVKLAAEREEAKTAKRRAEHLETEQAHIRKQLDNMCTLRDAEERKSGKCELQFREALENIQDREEVIKDLERKVRLEKQEKDELIRENQRLMSDLEGLRRGYSDLHTAPPDDSTYEQPNDTAMAEDTPQVWQQDTADESDHLYEPIAPEKQPTPSHAPSHQAHFVYQHVSKIVSSSSSTSSPSCHLIGFLRCDITGCELREESRQPVLSFSRCLGVQPGQALFQKLNPGAVSHLGQLENHSVVHVELRWDRLHQDSLMELIQSNEP